MKNLAKTNDGECLSNEYRGNKSKLTWKCKKGHIWEAKPNYVIMGHWCKICGMRRAGEKNKFTIGEVQNISKRHEGSLISKEYIDGKHKLEWVCKKGHVFFMTAPKANYGQWCPICAGRDKSERICRLFFEEIFDKKFPKVRPKWLISESGNRLELDGYCEELKLAFEFNGKQHYEFVGKFHKTRSLQETKKRELCEINNVSLMIIPYTFKIKYLQEYIINRCKKLGIRLPSNIKIIDYKTINV
jgi:hypothetical protein